ncbi:MAG TPA: 23S rRNA (uracil(1939)-C(5))-methyltransferase RlmD [Acidobacteriaceae bacterium]
MNKPASMSGAITLRIEKAVYGGAGLTRLPDGKAALVPLTLPGESVEARVSESKRGPAQGELIAVLEASPKRTTPGCRHYGICGGCSYQHAEYAAQLEMKRGILAETMVRAGVTPPEITVHASEPWAYRNRIRMHFVREDGALRLGYKQRRSHTAFAVDECPIAAPLLVCAADALCNAIADVAWVEGAIEAEFFCDAAESSLQVAVLLKPGSVANAAEFSAAMESLRETVTELVGAGIYEQAGNPTAAPRELTRWGADALNCNVGAHAYRVSRGAFFQVNRFLAEELVQLVAEGRSGALVWDLYAGAGLFSLALAENFARVVAVESAVPAVHDLQHNLALAGEQHRAIESTTLEFLRRTATPSSKKPPQLIVLDPPRAGLGAAVCELLAQVGAAEMVYVSCDPVTLSRDLSGLIKSGYHVHAVHMADLFPQTFHLETVTVLRKN